MLPESYDPFRDQDDPTGGVEGDVVCDDCGAAGWDFEHNHCVKDARHNVQRVTPRPPVGGGPVGGMEIKGRKLHRWPWQHGADGAEAVGAAPETLAPLSALSLSAQALSAALSAATSAVTTASGRILADEAERAIERGVSTEPRLSPPLARLTRLLQAAVETTGDISPQTRLAPLLMVLSALHHQVRATTLPDVDAMRALSVLAGGCEEVVRRTAEAELACRGSGSDRKRAAGFQACSDVLGEMVRSAGGGDVDLERQVADIVPMLKSLVYVISRCEEA